MTYPASFRRKVLSVREKEGLSIAQVAKRFSVGIASVTRWIRNPEPQTTRRKPATKIDPIKLARDVREYPDAYQYERARRLKVSQKGIDHALRRMGITYKKNTGASQGDALPHGMSSRTRWRRIKRPAGASFI